MPEGNWGIAPFFAERGSNVSATLLVAHHSTSAPRPRRATPLRVLRALQLPKAALLEGSPGRRQDQPRRSAGARSW